MPVLRKILVVDDEPAVLLTYELVLRHQGFDVGSAASSQEADELLAKSKFDVLISDLGLRGDKDGLAVIESARRRYPGIGCLLLTGFAEPEISDVAASKGIRVLLKPVHLPELLSTIRSLLGDKNAEQTPRAS
ncbi:MAG TPA: response regulator [Terriglobales bacterium]|nr:response regulator [Terriglobales bacterium]